MSIFKVLHSLGSEAFEIMHSSIYKVNTNINLRASFGDILFIVLRSEPPDKFVLRWIFRGNKIASLHRCVNALHSKIKEAAWAIPHATITRIMARGCYSQQQLTSFRNMAFVNFTNKYLGDY